MGRTPIANHTMRNIKTRSLLLAGPAACALLLAIPSTGPVATSAGVQNDQLNAVLWMQRSAEYDANCLQVFGQARRQIGIALLDKNWTGCLEQVGQKGLSKLPPAIITDIDETVLDNSAFNARMVADGTEYDAGVWKKWTEEEQALPVPGAIGFFAAAHALGIRVVYITNRKVAEEESTRRNLQRLGFPLVEASGEDLVLTKGEIGDKAARRRHVCKSYRVLEIIGDNFGDFMPWPKPRKENRQGDAVEGKVTEVARRARVSEYAALWGQQWFILPNPVYGSWLDVLAVQAKDRHTLLRLQRRAAKSK
jgi:5'-nucleotidase (lipoprotein e(P4) family)